MAYSLILLNNTTKKTKLYIYSPDLEDSRLYYHFQGLDTSDLDEGEYTYYLVENEETDPIEVYPNNVRKSTMNGKPIQIVAVGIIRIGNYTRPSTEYNPSSTYKQYNG